jgi:hypothetical protein
MAYDVGPFASRLEKANANLACLCCGSTSVMYSDARYMLIELDSDDRLAVQPDWGLGSGAFCGARICHACGYVHLHSLLVIDGQGYPEAL